MPTTTPAAVPAGLRATVLADLRRAAGALHALWLLVLPVECAGCGRADTALCPGCRRPLDGAAAAVSSVAVPVPVHACAPYSGSLPRIVVAWKDRGRLDLTRRLAVPLAAAVAASLDSARAGPSPGAPADPGLLVPVLLVPVPSSPGATRARGADVVALLTAVAARRLRGAGEPVRVGRLLRQRRRVSDQAGLGARSRAANVAGAFELRRPLLRGLPPRARVVVVDDVVTTGASAAEAVRVLQDHGAVVLGVAAVAWTPLRGAVRQKGFGRPTREGRKH